MFYPDLRLRHYQECALRRHISAVAGVASSLSSTILNFSSTHLNLVIISLMCCWCIFNLYIFFRLSANSIDAFSQLGFDDGAQIVCAMGLADGKALLGDVPLFRSKDIITGPLSSGAQCFFPAQVTHPCLKYSYSVIFIVFAFNGSYRKFRNTTDMLF